ncbi:MAG: response regulator transcription factor [Ruminiclostridium sp.]|nr:response regulator transcription factor [Ruminiclostridium sp.]MBQ8791620.1 response regulator transcription factor [Ruminiclostridium sp.]
MAKILIVEDDNDINALVKETLNQAGHNCTQAYSGTEGLLYAKSEEFSLALLDLMLPGMSGEELLKEIKKIKDIPVIIMSAKDSIDTKIELLTTGAEDYITKPFDIKELQARVAVQLRRFSEEGNQASERLSFEELTLDTASMTVFVKDNALELTKHEYKIMELFIKNPDKVFSKQAIYDYAWEDYYIGEDKTINVHISNIRKKLKAYSDREYIETVWGIGFKLKK